MKKKEFLSTGEAARALGVSVKTIQRWDKAGLLPAIRTATNQRRILVDTVHHLLKGQGKALRCAIYARVSSARQEHEANLTRQVERLQRVVQQRSYEMVACIQEQASGLNEKRTGLKQLLHLIDHQEIDLVLIEHPDRLVPFGYGYLEETFRWKQVRIEVVEPPELQTPPEELVADVLSFVTAFSGRLYGSQAKEVRSRVSHALKDCLKAEAADGTNR